MWTLLAPIIFQAVKMAEKAISGKRKGKDKKKLVKGILKTAFDILHDLRGVPFDMPTFDEVEDQIESAVLGLRVEQNPALELKQEPDHTVTLTTNELIQVIAAAAGRSYP